MTEILGTQPERMLPTQNLFDQPAFDGLKTVAYGSITWPMVRKTASTVANEFILNFLSNYSLKHGVPASRDDIDVEAVVVVEPDIVKKIVADIYEDRYSLSKRVKKNLDAIPEFKSLGDGRTELVQPLINSVLVQLPDPVDQMIYINNMFGIYDYNGNLKIGGHKGSTELTFEAWKNRLVLHRKREVGQASKYYGLDAILERIGYLRESLTKVSR